MDNLEFVRLLIPDTDSSNYALTDEQINGLLERSRNKPWFAAAQALEIIATDEALVYKIVTTDDLSINGVTGAAQVLLARAKQLRADQVKEDIETSPSEGFQLVFPDQVADLGYPFKPEASAWPLC